LALTSDRELTESRKESGKYQPRHARRGRPTKRWARRFLVGLNVLVALSLVGAGTIYGYVKYRVSQLKTKKLPALVQQTSGLAPMNILLVGNNTRTGLEPGEAAQFGSSTLVAGARSDVTMILHLDPVKNSASLLSIPRDLFVVMPANSVAGPYGKIDGALNGTNGSPGGADGPNTLIAAIQDSLGIPINHYVEINFDGFRRTIDAIGGISMSFPTQLRDAESGLNITTTGCQKLNGATALGVVRARHLQYKAANGRWVSDPLSDLARIRRDHTFLRIFVNAAKSQMTDPLSANALIGGLLNQVTVDSHLNLGGMLTLFRHYKHLDPNTVPEMTLPITVVQNYHYAGGVYGDVDLPVEPLDHQLIDTWAGQPLPAADPGSFNVQLRNISGVSGRTTTIGNQLGGLGFHVTGATAGSAPATVSATVVRYHPGAVDQALAVVRALSGAVSIHADPAVAEGGVVVDVGSTVAVITPAAATTTVPATASTTVPAKTGAPATTTPATTTPTTIPTPGGQPPSPALDQPQPFDPVACP
jgi:LCP family protein required for cell wall assembly